MLINLCSTFINPLYNFFEENYVLFQIFNKLFIELDLENNWYNLFHFHFSTHPLYPDIKSKLIVCTSWFIKIVYWKKWILFEILAIWHKFVLGKNLLKFIVSNEHIFLFIYQFNVFLMYIKSYTDISFWIKSFPII